MIKNYFIIAWRNMVRNKAFSAINIAGLSMGVACSVLIMLWVQNEMAIDGFHVKGDRIFKVYEREYYADNTSDDYDTPGLLGAELKKTFPEVEDAVMLQDNNDRETLQAGGKILKAEGSAASAGFFSMFSFPLVQGNATTALKDLSGIAISEKTAVEFFGTAAAAMGKTIRFDNRKDFIVSAVFADITAMSSRKMDWLINWEGFQQDHPWTASWQNSGPLTYVLLKQGTRAAAVDSKLTHFLEKYNGHATNGYRVELGLQPMGEVYLHNHFKNGMIDGGRIEYVRLFSAIALFILLIACINFMNLATARSVKRAREIGVRKVAGALRSSLIQQFIGESMMLTGLAVAIALVLVSLLLHPFNTVTQKQMELPFTDGFFWLKITALVIVTGLIAGSYPALFLSGFNPAKVLKGELTQGSKGAILRKGLVVFQFSLAMILITGTLVVSRQINFIQSKNLGYDKGNLIWLPLEGDLKQHFATFKISALQMPGIENIALVSDDPSYLDQNTNGVDWEGRPAGTLVSFEHPAVGYDFVRTMKMEMAAGRDFSKDFPTDADGCIINETALRIFKFDKPLGQRITINGRKLSVVGVVKDFHFRSLHENIKPVIMELMQSGYYGNILVRTKPGQTKQALTSLSSLSKSLNPQFPFDYTFADEAYRKLYRSEEVIGQLSRAFAFLGIFISCLGLLGLVMFTAEQRTKEIGIRKVLGASVAGIAGLLTTHFLKLVLLAILVATPIGWWAMQQWLNGYAYKTELSWWMFGLAGSLAIFIALLTISFQAIKAALANPVKSLRTE